jgi:ribosome-binding factor A
MCGRETHVPRAAAPTMEYQRSDRVGDLLVELISELLSRELGDPRVRGVTLTGAKVTKDLKLARIFFNVLGGAKDRENVLAGLRSASGFIRSRAGKELKLKFVPAIEFIYDETEDQAQRIAELLKKTKE